MAEEQVSRRERPHGPPDQELLRGLQIEMKRVTWPPWKQVRATTVVVIVAVFAFAAYFFLVDIFVGRRIART